MNDLKKLSLEELFEREDLDFDNDGEVQYLVGLCYKDGKGTDIDNDAASEWFAKARKNGYEIEEYDAEEHIYNQTEKINYKELSMSELARLCNDGDERAILSFAEEYDESLAAAIKTLDKIKDDDNREDYNIIMKKYEVLGKKALEAKNIKQSTEYFKYALEFNSKIAEYYLVDVYLARIINNIDELSMLKALSSRGNVKASYFLARAFFTHEIYVDIDKIKVALILDDVINDGETPSGIKNIAKGFMRILDKNFKADIHQIIIEEETKYRSINQENDNNTNSKSIEGIYLDVIGLEYLKAYEKGDEFDVNSFSKGAINNDDEVDSQEDFDNNQESETNQTEETQETYLAELNTHEAKPTEKKSRNSIKELTNKIDVDIEKAIKFSYVFMILSFFIFWFGGHFFNTPAPFNKHEMSDIILWLMDAFLFLLLIFISTWLVSLRSFYDPLDFDECYYPARLVASIAGNICFWYVAFTIDYNSQFGTIFWEILLITIPVLIGTVIINLLIRLIHRIFFDR